MYEIFLELLNTRGITASAFCKATGVSAATISMWKKRNSTCSMDTAKKVAEYFGVSTDYVMYGERDNAIYYTDESTADMAQAMFNDPTMRTLYKIKQDLDPEVFDNWVKYFSKMVYQERDYDS